MTHTEARWWKAKAKADPRGDWRYLGINQTPLSASWRRMESLNDLHRNECVDWRGMAPYDPSVMEELNACPVCKKWDRAATLRPIDIPLMPTNRRAGTVSPYFYDAMWISKPFGTPIVMMHRKLLDAVGEDFDDDILIGEVHILGGDRVPDLVSVLDRATLRGRAKYRKSLFNYPGTSRFRPCHYCGRLDPFGWSGPDYIFTPEFPNRSPRVGVSELLVSPETFAKGGFDDARRWPKLKIHGVKQSAELLDPIPSPFPTHWEALESAFSERGIVFPFHRLSLPRSEPPGPWLQRRIAEHGKAACVVTRKQTKPWDPGTLESAVFYLRVRALFEPKIAERIGRWTDDQLVEFLKGYKQASGSHAGYFPL